jgi:osmotically-inducible protein OsmY
MARSDVLSRVRDAFDADPRVRAAGRDIELGLDRDGSVTLAGEVATLAAKRVALERACAIPDVFKVVDRLRVAPQRRFSDERIRRCLLDLLLDDAAFADYEIVAPAEAPSATRAAASFEGERPVLGFRVVDGVVVLEGRAVTPDHKQLAGVLAWWVPGVRDVRNDLVVDQPGADGDADIADGVRLALDRDPLVDASAVVVEARAGVVRLTGTLATADARAAAESDAWYVLGVRDVVNEVSVVGRR